MKTSRAKNNSSTAALIMNAQAANAVASSARLEPQLSALVARKYS